MSRLEYDLKKSIKAPKAPSSKDLLEEDEFDISEYLDEQIVVNATISKQLKSTLHRLDNTYGKSINKNSVLISENESLGDDTSET